MNHLEMFLFDRLKKPCSQKYRDAVLNVIHRLLINQTYHVELGSIRYKSKNKSWIIKKQYEG